MTPPEKAPAAHPIAPTVVRNQEKLWWLHSVYALLFGIGVMWLRHRNLAFLRVTLFYVLFIWITSLLLPRLVPRLGRAKPKIGSFKEIVFETRSVRGCTRSTSVERVLRARLASQDFGYVQPVGAKFFPASRGKPPYVPKLHKRSSRSSTEAGAQGAGNPRSDIMTWAQLYPTSPVTLPPGWQLPPHRYNPATCAR